MALWEQWMLDLEPSYYCMVEGDDCGHHQNLLLLSLSQSISVPTHQQWSCCCLEHLHPSSASHAPSLMSYHVPLLLLLSIPSSCLCHLLSSPRSPLYASNRMIVGQPRTRQPSQHVRKYQNVGIRFVDIFWTFSPVAASVWQLCPLHACYSCMPPFFELRRASDKRVSRP